MTDQPDPQPLPLQYHLGVNPLNGYQRASAFALRVIGLSLMTFAAVGVVSLVGGAAVGMDVYPVGRHVFAIGEYGLLGGLAAVFSKPVGRWLGAAV